MSANVTIQDAQNTQGNNVEVTCPECNTSRVINVATYRNTKRRVKAKCGCGCIFDMSDFTLDLRKFYRKRTNLRGSYSCVSMNKTGFMRVKDLSYSGIAFEMEKADDIEVGDTLGVRFVLDDERKTEIHRAVIVKNIRDRFVGAEFSDNQVFDIELCYYLALS